MRSIRMGQQSAIQPTKLDWSIVAVGDGHQRSRRAQCCTAGVTTRAQSPSRSNSHSSNRPIGYKDRLTKSLPCSGDDRRSLSTWVIKYEGCGLRHYRTAIATRRGLVRVTALPKILKIWKDAVGQCQECGVAKKWHSFWNNRCNCCKVGCHLVLKSQARPKINIVSAWVEDLAKRKICSQILFFNQRCVRSSPSSRPSEM